MIASALAACEDSGAVPWRWWCVLLTSWGVVGSALKYGTLMLSSVVSA